MKDNMKKRACVFLGLPVAQRTSRSCFSTTMYMNTAKEDVDVFQQKKESSLLPHSFNQLWVEVNGRANCPFTHFVMLHDDIEPEPYFISTLLDLMEEKKADLISTVVPIKNNSGRTSTAVGSHDDPYDYRRLTIKEIAKLPETFSIDDLPDYKAAGKCLLANTGLFIVDIRNPVWRSLDINSDMVFKFGFQTRIRVWPDGKYNPDVEPEDWGFSRVCAKYNLKVFSTRKIKVIHNGTLGYPNYEVWGEETDTEMDEFLAAKKSAYEFPVKQILKSLNERKDKCLV